MDDKLTKRLPWWKQWVLYNIIGSYEVLALTPPEITGIGLVKPGRSGFFNTVEAVNSVES
jgi:hypothetical protein